jgi:hypothetical protein
MTTYYWWRRLQASGYDIVVASNLFTSYPESLNSIVYLS